MFAWLTGKNQQDVLPKSGYGTNGAEARQKQQHTGVLPAAAAAGGDSWGGEHVDSNDAPMTPVVYIVSIPNSCTQQRCPPNPSSNAHKVHMLCARALVQAAVSARLPLGGATCTPYRNLLILLQRSAQSSCPCASTLPGCDRCCGQALLLGA